ncbi:hypothetical protein C8Q78DRAFT_765940 [Trametes maxima]|nr:hypothetical protein C8Q78DRAFT_765940 [Trametes maxima]
MALCRTSAGLVECRTIRAHSGCTYVAWRSRLQHTIMIPETCVSDAASLGCVFATQPSKISQQSAALANPNGVCRS